MYTFAAIQMDLTLLKPDKNLKKIVRLANEAADLGARVMVFPECAVTGYALSAEEADEFAQPIPGPVTHRLVELCRERDIYVALGLIEKFQQNLLFNSSVLIGPEGLIGCYRKTHLPLLGVDRYLAQAGSLSGPFGTNVGSIGMLICYDLRFPEPIRVLALKGAQIILVSTAWPSAASLYPEFMAQARSAENSIYLVAANRVGEERGTRYLGRSVITGPNGELLAEGSSESEEILLAKIDPQRSLEKRRIFKPDEYELDLFGDRRPELYTPLTE
ncbi:MAG: carbon-nitrogen hydrolase family protein [Anaerolineales bacterium]|nr:carbon-nitrogen hydrolase family protein [Anaerolineales bacterium]